MDPETLSKYNPILTQKVLCLFPEHLLIMESYILLTSGTSLSSYKGTAECQNKGVIELHKYNLI